MLVIFAVIIGGIIAGRLLSSWRLVFVSRMITVIIWLLLFLLGLEVGSDPAVVGGMATLGRTAFVIFACSVAGSICMSWLLWRCVRRGTASRPPAEGMPEQAGAVAAGIEAPQPRVTTSAGTGMPGPAVAVECPGQNAGRVAGEHVVSGADAALSMWGALRGSLVIVAFFVAGVADGLGDIAAGGEGAGEASSDDVGGVHEEDEGVRVDVFYEVADAGDLGEVDDGEDNFLVSAGESALAVEEGRAVVDGAQDGIRDFKRLVGDDEGCFSLGKTKDETAGEVRIDVHADQGADGWFQSEDPCTGHDDDEVQCEDDVADFQVVVLLDDGTDDVEAAGIAVVTVKDTHGDAQDDTAGDGSDDRVLDDVVVSQEGREVDEKGKENGPEDRDDGVKFPHEFQGETEDWEVQDKVRDADRNAGQVVYNHGDTCQPASQELVRDEEGIDADGINESA